MGETSVSAQNFLGSEVLDIGIGMSLLFLFISLICAAVREGIEGWRKTRALQLHHVLREIMDDKTKTGGSDLVRQLYNHPSIYSLYSGEYPARLRGRWWKRLPSYIPAANFSSALLDIIVHGDPSGVAINPQTPLSTDAIRSNIGNLKSTKVERAVLAAFDFAAADLSAGRKNLEDWYNSAMDRVSGWYKRTTQLVLFVLGLFAAVVLNIDALTVAGKLGQNKALREAVVGAARFAKPLAQPAAAATPGQAATPQLIDDVALRGQLERVSSLVGWEERLPPRTAPFPNLFPTPQSRIVSCRPDPRPGAPSGCSAAGFAYYVGYKETALMVLGWLVTAFAITLGAPFWFDLLNKFMVVRSTVKPHEKSREERSKDATAG
jgi:hypothetical protein